MTQFLFVISMAWRHAMHQPYRNLLSILSLSLGIGMLAASVALGLGVRQFVLTQVLQTLPIDMIEARPKGLDLGFIKLPAGSPLGAGLGEAPLDAARLAALAALPHVAGVYPKRHLNLPLGAQGGAQLLGHPVYADLFVTALPEALVRGAACPDFVDLDPSVERLADDAVIPLVVAPQLIALYNSTLAPALGTPLLTAQHLTGLRFDMVVGRSLLLGKQNTHALGTHKAQIVGVSPFAAPLGGTIPWRYGQRLWAKYTTTDSVQSADAIDSIIVQAERPKDIVCVTDNILAAGLVVDETAQRVRHVLWGATWLLATGGALVLVLAASQTAFNLSVYVTQRRRQWSILQAIGMRRMQVVALIVLQAGAAGALGGTTGLGLAYATGLSVDTLLQRVWPGGIVVPQTLFLFPTSLSLACLFAAIAASIIGALGPAIAAVKKAVHTGLRDE